jgi:hypothetical protein
MIFFVSATIFHSSLVSPLSRKTSICGITLKAICFWNFFGSTSWPGHTCPWSGSTARPCLFAGARDRLIGRDDDALDAGAVMQRLQRHHHLRGRAVGVRDDHLVAIFLDRVGVHLGHDQRDRRVIAVKRAVIDHHAALRGGDGGIFFRRVRADGEQRDVIAGEVEPLDILGLQGLVAIADLSAKAPARSQSDNLIGRELALGENVQHFTAHVPRGADADPPDQRVIAIDVIHLAAQPHAQERPQLMDRKTKP